MLANIFKNKIIESDSSVLVTGLTKGVQASYVWNLFSETKQSILLVTNTLYEANNLYKALVANDINKVLFFPMDDFVVSEALATSPDLMSKRIETLN